MKKIKPAHNKALPSSRPLRFALACIGLCIWANANAAEPIWVEQKAVTSKYSFAVLVDTDDNGRHAEAIRVFDRKTRIVAQEILEIGGMRVPFEPTEMLWVADANFDGHPDIVLAFADGGAGPNSVDHFYLFVPQTQRFEIHETLSNLTQVSINANGTVTSSSRGSCCQHSSETYRFIDGKLTLIANWDESYTADGWIVTSVGKLRGGKMQFSEKKRRARH